MHQPGFEFPIIDFFVAAFTFGMGGIYWVGIPPGDRWHIMCSLIQIWAHGTVDHLFQVDSIFDLGVQGVATTPVITAGGNGDFLVAYSACSSVDMRDYLMLFWCHPVYAAVQRVKIEGLEDGQPTNPAVAYDKKEDRYIIAFSHPETNGCRSIRMYTYKRGRPDVEYLNTFYEDGKNLTHPAVAVSPGGDILMAFETEGEVWAAYKGAEDGGWVTFELGNVPGPGSHPSVAFGGMGTFSICYGAKASFFEAFVEEVDGDKETQISQVGKTYLFEGSSQTSVCAYRNAYFAITYRHSGHIYWTLFDYRGFRMLDPERVDHDMSSNDHVPVAVGLPWYKDLIVTWTGWDGDQHGVFMTRVFDDVTYYGPIPGWYAGDGHVHSARPVGNNFEKNPYYYSWLEGVYDYCGKTPHCNQAPRWIRDIKIEFPHPPTPLDQALGAELVGLQWIILTEHGPMLGLDRIFPEWVYDSNLAKENWQRIKDDCEYLTGLFTPNFIVIRGEEAGSGPWPLGTGNGHLLCYGITSHIEGGVYRGAYEEYYIVQLYRTLDTHEPQNTGSFAYIAHPAGPDNGNKWGFWEMYPGFFPDVSWIEDKPEYEKYRELIKGLEILTGLNEGLEANRDIWDHLLSIGHKLFGIGNSDGHWSFDELVRAKIGKVGRNRTFVYCPDGLNEKEVLDALKEGRTTFSSGIDQMYYTVQCGGQTYKPTGTVPHSALTSGTIATVKTTAPIKSLFMYFGPNRHACIATDVYEYYRDPSTGVYWYSIDITEYLNLVGAYFRLEGETVTGAKVFAQPIFVSWDSGFITLASDPAGAAGYDQMFYLREMSGQSQVVNMEYAVSDFVDGTGNMIPSGAISIVPHADYLEPGGLGGFAMHVSIPAGTPEGNYQGTIKITGTNAANGETVSSTVECTIVVDVTPPPEPILFELEDEDIDSLPITIRGEAEPGSFYEILVDGVVVTSGWVTVDGKISAQVFVGRGEHIITARCRDAYMNYSGESNLVSVNCLIDGIGPVCSIEVIGEKLPEKDWYGSDVTIVLSAVDEEGGSGLNKIEYLISGSDSWQEYLSPITITGDGEHYILYYAVDNEGNIGDFELARINIDRDVPVAHITGPAEGDVFTDMVAITGIADDLNFQSLEISYCLGQDPSPDVTWRLVRWSGAPGPTDSVLAVWDTSELQHGLYTIRLVVKDRAGRTSEDTVWVFAGARPVIDAVIPALATCGDEVTITGIAFGETQDSSYVSFGDVQATKYTLWSDTEIRLIVPSGVFGKVMLTVTTAGGTSDAVPITVMKKTFVSILELPLVQYSDIATIKATLTDDEGLPLEGRNLKFTVEGLSITLTTDSEGKATWTFPVDLAAGIYAVSVVYEGETLYVESSCEAILAVTREIVTTIYAGDTLVRSGESIALLAFINEEDDGFLGDIIRASSIVFEIWNSQGKVREVTAQITKISPGHAVAEALTEPLPSGLYTVRVRLSHNSYYQSEEVSSELAVYDPEAGFAYGAGIIKEDGLKTFCFNVSYSKRDQTRPRGHFSFTDRTNRRDKIRIVATSFTYLVIPENEDKAYIKGECTFRGERGYTFFLEIEDKDRRHCHSSDTIHIVVKDSLGNIVYEAEGTISAGVIAIHRRKKRCPRWKK